jgi:hypothetical protein
MFSWYAHPHMSTDQCPIFFHQNFPMLALLQPKKFEVLANTKQVSQSFLLQLVMNTHVSPKFSTSLLKLWGGSGTNSIFCNHLQHGLKQSKINASSMCNDQIAWTIFKIEKNDKKPLQIWSSNIIKH